ncbi:MAG: hypothetical protein LUB63_01040, partial [Oscillospiraceae bacterium]|nr:hypothetical protein [Oscillospiraceae bacterium]
MKLRRRIISAALSLVLALSLLPAAVFAEDATYTETVMLTTIASDGDVEFYDAYTSNADTEIIFAGGTSGTGVNTQSLDKGDGIVPASRTKYVHTDDSIDTKVVTGSYTYYLNYTDSAVKLERLNMSSVTFAVNSGTLTIGTSGSIDNVYVQGSDAVLNLTDNSKIYTYLYHSQGIVNLSGTVTNTKLYNFGVPMNITDSIEGSSI